VFDFMQVFIDQKWFQKEVDIWLIRENLKLSFEERAEQHQKMLQLIDELQEIGSANRARHSSSTQTADSQPR
jgi:hypothetical protein